MRNSTHEKQSNPTRRAVLQAISAAGLTTVTATATAGAPGESTTVGSFEEGLEGWRTNGSNELLRVSREEFPGVVSGSHALAVRTRGDPYPMVESENRLKDVDLVSFPYLSAEVLPVAFDSDSDIVFQFVLHHTPVSGTGNAGQSGEKAKKQKTDGNGRIVGRPRAKSSVEKRIGQHSKSTLTWDLSGYSEAVRRNAKRIEIRWYPADHEPSRTPRGNGPSTYEYSGFTVIDSIRAGDTPAGVEQTQLVDDLKRLKTERGMITSVDTAERTDEYETGRFTFSDGSTVVYELERLGEGQYRYTVDDTSYRVGGGWA